MAEQELIDEMGSTLEGVTYRAQVKAGNVTVMVELADTLLPRMAVMIMLDVVLTVVGSKLMLRLWNAPGLRAIDPEESEAETSMPMVAVKEPVTRAGEGFLIPPMSIITLSIKIGEGTAPLIVILFKLTLTAQV